MRTSVLNHLRQQEYTGENRCIPCTAVNVIIAVVFGLVVAWLWLLVAGPFAWFVGGLVLIGGLVTIWLRGYLVPGTPALTKQYFPERILRQFGTHPPRDARATGLGGAGETGDIRSDTDSQGGRNGNGSGSTKRREAESWLSEAGVIVPCEQVNDLCVNEQFHTGWYEQMETIKDNETERDVLAEEFDFTPSEIEFEDRGNEFVALTESQLVGLWESRAAMVADVAAARELPDWIDEWNELSTGLRSQLLGSLRVFLDFCPVCDAPVQLGRETVNSCCRSTTVYASTCNGCDARLFEIPYSDAT